MREDTEKAFFALLRAGLWEKEIRLSFYGEIDFSAVLDLAEEQSVVGLVAAGIEHVADMKPAKMDVLQFVARTVQIEQQNQMMNQFIAELIEKMGEAGIYTVLVKGQGIAQCYERPLWRACGDVDFFLNDENYVAAKAFLALKAESVDLESGKHLGMTVDSWTVELHGNLHCGLSSKMDSLIDKVQKDVFGEDKVRPWLNGETQIFLPAVNEDVILIFTHFLKHFYKGGIGLRQICDWCRLLWTFRSEVDTTLLQQRLRSMGLMSEWNAFGVFAVEYLGMDAAAMPFYSDAVKWKRKASRIKNFVMSVGNMGHNRGSWLTEHGSWLGRQYVVRKAFSMFRRIGDLINHARIFPLDSLRFFPRIMWNGIVSAVKGE